jgi:hypothetical protein
MLTDNSEWHLTALLSSLDDAQIFGWTATVDSPSSHTEVSVHAIITERKVTSTEKSIANIFVFIYKWFRRFSLDKVSNCIEKDGDTFPNRNV